MVGIWSSKHKTETPDDYLVASRDVSPWMTALSAVSTNNSGYMFIGLIGYAFRDGVEAIWITLGWILGDFFTWLWVHRRVREQSEELGAASVPSFLAMNSEGKLQRPVAVVAGLLTLVFLGAYAAAQLKSGSITLNSLFGWDLWVGSVIGVVVVAIYCMAGGIRASIWTDSAQSIVMIGAMTMLLLICVNEVGGPSALMQQLEAMNPKLVEWTPRALLFGVPLWAIGFVFGGIGTIGQPHILVRFMALDAVDSVKKTRNIYFLWYIFFSLAAFSVALYARVLLPELGAGLTGQALTDASESALPMVAVKMLPSALIGVMLAGIFSATMSTADSQILSCSAAITQDIFPQLSDSYTASKVATLGVAGLALAIALGAGSGVFSIVLLAWAGLAASLGPVLLVRLAKKSLPTWLGIVMMATGLLVVFVWGKTPYGDSLYKALPGMMAPIILYLGAHLAGLTKQR